MTRLDRLALLTAREPVGILEWFGFVPIRPGGSHLILRHADGRPVTVPIHAKRGLGKGLPRQILRDARLIADDLRR